MSKELWQALEARNAEQITNLLNHGADSNAFNGEEYYQRHIPITFLLTDFDSSYQTNDFNQGLRSLLTHGANPLIVPREYGMNAINLSLVRPVFSNGEVFLSILQYIDNLNDIVLVQNSNLDTGQQEVRNGILLQGLASSLSDGDAINELHPEVFINLIHQILDEDSIMRVGNNFDSTNFLQLYANSGEEHSAAVSEILNHIPVITELQNAPVAFVSPFASNATTNVTAHPVDHETTEATPMPAGNEPIIFMGENVHLNFHTI